MRRNRGQRTHRRSANAVDERLRQRQQATLIAKLAVARAAAAASAAWLLEAAELQQVQAGQTAGMHASAQQLEEARVTGAGRAKHDHATHVAPPLGVRGQLAIDLFRRALFANAGAL